MATSDTGICNLALRELREQPITALTDTSEPARFCNQFFDETRDELLELWPHNFAMTRQQLSQEASSPLFEWDYAYALPTDPYCLRPVRLWHNGAWQEKWVVEGRQILTDYDSDVYLLYVARVTDYAAYPATFVRAFALRLAQQLAYPITRSNTVEARMADKFKRAWRRYRAIDGATGWHAEFAESVFTDVRTSGTVASDIV